MWRRKSAVLLLFSLVLPWTVAAFLRTPPRDWGCWGMTKVPILQPLRPLWAQPEEQQEEEQQPTEDNADLTLLSQRIANLKTEQEREEASLIRGLQSRVMELERSDLTNVEGLQSFPTICYDALLPGQKLRSITTDDETFGRLLQELGLGGWLVLISLDFRRRQLRRHGSLVKIVALDGVARGENQVSLATAVSFDLQAVYRCRVLGPCQGMQARVGRWRRCYDDNGEEALLGWGQEGFVDSPLGEDGQEKNTETQPSHHTEWSNTIVLCNLDNTDREEVPADLISQLAALDPLVNEWAELASDPDTFVNPNVTATCRVHQGEPMLRVDPTKLLAQVFRDIGDKPDVYLQPTAYCFWVGALINPIPPMGVSLEIRGRLLEAATLKDRVAVVEQGLFRSLANLRGDRPLC